MDVSDVLRDRMQGPAGLQRMALLSIVAHGVAVALVLVAPGGWAKRASEPPRTIMTISLGGTPGPATGGMSSIGGRPVQAVTPPDEANRREAVRPPAAKAPDMTMPSRITRNRPAAAIKQAPDEARGRTPTRGQETVPGTAIADTGVRGKGFGLSTGGGGTGGVTLDVADFCCPDYIIAMRDRIRAAWNPRAEFLGTTTIKFTIQRDGRILPSDVVLEKSSGYTALDLTAQRAVYMTKQLPPLPAAFPNPTLPVHLTFEYQR